MKNVLFCLLCFCGCAPYRSEITFAGAKLALPKDASFAWMQVNIPTTNGAASIIISNGLFRMNPSVIDAKTAHDVGVINAVGDKVLQGVGAAIPK